MGFVYNLLKLRSKVLVQNCFEVGERPIMAVSLGYCPNLHIDCGKQLWSSLEDKVNEKANGENLSGVQKRD